MSIVLTDDQFGQLQQAFDDAKSAHQSHDDALAAKGAADAAAADAAAKQQAATAAESSAASAEDQAEAALGDLIASLRNPPAPPTAGTADTGNPPAAGAIDPNTGQPVIGTAAAVTA